MRTRQFVSALLPLLVLALTGPACKRAADSSPGPEDGARPPPRAEKPAEPGPKEPAEEPVAGGGAAGDGANEDGAAGSPGTGGDDAPASADREPLVSESHEQHARVEGTSFDNSCETDADCHTGGCSSEICSAEQGVNSTCIMPANGWPSKGGSCGCVEGQCRWYGGAGQGGGDAGDGEGAGEVEESGEASASAPGQGETCENGKCAGELTCMTYYGVAGPQGPKFSSCEIPCKGKKGLCPEGQACITIADGPGRVCRPAK